MKRFLIYVASCLLIALPVIVLANVVDLMLVREKYKIKIPNGRRSIIIGPSTTGCSINDTIVDFVCNMSENGCHYPALYPQLKNILDNNDLDTVYLSSVRNTLYYVNENELNKEIADINRLYHRMAQSDAEEFKDYWMPQKRFIRYFLHYDIKHLKNFRSPQVPSKGLGFLYLVRDNIHHGQWSIEWQDSANASKPNDFYSYERLTNDCSLITKYFRKSIELCRQRGVVPVLLNVPIYHYDRWFSDKGYLDFLATLDPDLLIADYEHYSLPDSCYGDVFHLNHKGARVLSEDIKANGFKTQRLRDYIRDARARTPDSQ